eukprot:scaffold77164_cov39-Attheya_sp.AAC.1
MLEVQTLVCCRQRPAWVSWVVVLLLLSDLGTLSCRAQANELNENVEFKRGLADWNKIGRGNRRRKPRPRNPQEKDSPTTEIPPADEEAALPPHEEDLVVKPRRRKRPPRGKEDRVVKTRRPLPRGANEIKSYFDLERGGRLEKYRLRNGIDDYEWSFEYYVEFIGDLRLFNDTERDTLSLAFNESYTLLNISYSTILDIYFDNQTLTDIDNQTSSSSNRRLRRRSLISRFRGISLCRRCPKKRFRDPLFESRTKRRFLKNGFGDVLLEAGELAVDFLEAFNEVVIVGNASLVKSGQIQLGLEEIGEEIKVASIVPTSSPTTSPNQEPTQPTNDPT